MADLLATHIDVLISLLAAGFLIVKWLENKRPLYLIGAIGLIIVGIYQLVSAFNSYNSNIANDEKMAKTKEILQASVMKKLAIAPQIEKDTNLIIEGLVGIEIDKDAIVVSDTLNDCFFWVIQNFKEENVYQTSLLKIPYSSSLELSELTKEVESNLISMHPNAKFNLNESFEKIGEEYVAKNYSLTLQNGQEAMGTMVHFRVKNSLFLLTYTYPKMSQEKANEITKENRKYLKLLQ